VIDGDWGEEGDGWKTGRGKYSHKNTIFTSINIYTMNEGVHAFDVSVEIKLKMNCKGCKKVSNLELYRSMES